MPRAGRPLISAGLLMTRRRAGVLEVLLVHPGGPFFKNKDAGAWSIPKGMIEHAEEDLLSRAKIEFQEELGAPALADSFTPLGSVKQKGGKIVHAWTFTGDFEGPPRSNNCRYEWPPRSGQWREFPEVDDARWFTVEAAREKINAAQVHFLERLCALSAEQA